MLQQLIKCCPGAVYLQVVAFVDTLLCLCVHSLTYIVSKMKKVVTGLDEMEEERNVAWILDLACRNEFIARGVEKFWTAKFVEK